MGRGGPWDLQGNPPAAETEASSQGPPPRPAFSPPREGGVRCGPGPHRGQAGSRDRPLPACPWVSRQQGSLCLCSGPLPPTLFTSLLPDNALPAQPWGRLKAASWVKQAPKAGPSTQQAPESGAASSGRPPRNNQKAGHHPVEAEGPPGATGVVWSLQESIGFPQPHRGPWTDLSLPLCLSLPLAKGLSIMR